MIEPIFSAIEKLIVDFSWKRALFIVIVAGVAAYSIFMFEWYTGYFQLNRIQKTTEILSRLQEIESKMPSSGDNIKKTHNELLLELKNTSYTRKIVSPFSYASRMTYKQKLLTFIFGASPWLLVIIFGVKNARKGQPGGWIAVIMLSLIAVLFGWLGTFLPSILWPWGILLGYPVVQIFILSAIAITTTLRASKNARRTA